ncbi:hypothetical protein LEP1GSC049_2964 [Leptospira kirschneri serovar Cynopteri str. 3522 CT]|nr:hypothetical protein LEP1GSC044_0394 [Leptospira kirschneri serovar Grippotyphosa str. RM52]EKQ85641.1 hypothetical protein LEP1GSC064_0518 [Leptospira kirschneri serovar Grippotyphosa str. Moskva]EKR09326.1 hypothetical protein LEP1GSC122_0125 [Leptospira kirschneri serovar Valbuzzi str. 200702274]EMK04093.1 hypothetical protein LEP1GSC176_2452 [Leptospira kirschneri str. MMD1493]EMK07974.1 hypothetical protein LEP1GSC166_3985 [Leptospira kirschneri]EMK11796.1 hypothetical protein LEP1GSC0
MKVIRETLSLLSLIFPDKVQLGFGMHCKVNEMKFKIKMNHYGKQ